MVANRFDTKDAGDKKKTQATSAANPVSGAWTVDDCVCPVCSSMLQCPNVTRGKADRYDRIIREAFGWCFECATGYAFFQFNNNGRWLTHRYREYTEGEKEGEYQTSGPWKTLYQLPEPAPVMLGVGGGYDQAIAGDDILKILKTARDIAGKTWLSFNQLIEGLHQK